MKNTLSKLEKYLGSMKIGLVFMGILIIILIISTFLESYTNSSFADRLIYSSFWFKILMGIIAFNVIFSLIRRFPFKLKFLGFYIIHISILMILGGGFLTSYTGIDGSIVLYPDQAANEVELNTHEIVIYKGENQDGLLPSKTYSLPYSAYGEDLDEMIYPDISVKKYLPFSDERYGWGNETLEDDHYSVVLEVKDKNHQNKVILTNHPNSKFNSRGTFRDINFTLLPIKMMKCFLNETPNDFFFWDIKKQVCFIPPKNKVTVGISKLGNRFIDYNHQGNQFKFWPEMSPRPMQGHGNIVENAPVMVLSKKIFKNEKDIVFFDDNIFIFDTKKEKFLKKKLSPDWVKLDSIYLRMVRDSKTRPIIKAPYYKVPKTGENSKAAVLISNNGKDFWVFFDRPLTFRMGGQIIGVSLERKKIKLPMHLTLKRFNMDYYPGSQMPSTYQSFVTIDRNDDVKKIAMNNPLNLNGFRFFQSSYFEIERNEFASVLSVGRDPGRLLKYLGSILLFIGCFYYYSKKMRKD